MGTIWMVYSEYKCASGEPLANFNNNHVCEEEDCTPEQAAAVCLRRDPQESPNTVYVKHGVIQPSDSIEQLRGKCDKNIEEDLCKYKDNLIKYVCVKIQGKEKFECFNLGIGKPVWTNVGEDRSHLCRTQTPEELSELSTCCKIKN